LDELNYNHSNLINEAKAIGWCIEFVHFIWNVQTLYDKFGKFFYLKVASVISGSRWHNGQFHDEAGSALLVSKCTIMTQFLTIK
jgi:hypothetical protein